MYGSLQTGRARAPYAQPTLLLEKTATTGFRSFRRGAAGLLVSALRLRALRFGGVSFWGLESELAVGSGSRGGAPAAGAVSRNRDGRPEGCHGRARRPHSIRIFPQRRGGLERLHDA